MALHIPFAFSHLGGESNASQLNCSYRLPQFIACFDPRYWIISHYMRSKTPQITSVQRTLAMLEAIIADDGSSSISQIARSQGTPIATAHRQVRTLVAAGFLTVTANGRHVAGARLMGLLRQLDHKQLVVTVAAPLLHQLASRLRSVVQLGTLEDDMVTYRVKTGNHAAAILSRVGMQLEAYCSAIGKVLLSHLSEPDLDAYLGGGAFVALTDNTITQPDMLRQELQTVREQGFAVDNEEIVSGLRCHAVPLEDMNGDVVAAISVSRPIGGNKMLDDESVIKRLKDVAHEIERMLHPVLPD